MVTTRLDMHSRVLRVLCRFAWSVLGRFPGFDQRLVALQSRAQVATRRGFPDQSVKRPPRHQLGVMRALSCLAVLPILVWLGRSWESDHSAAAEDSRGGCVPAWSLDPGLWALLSGAQLGQGTAQVT